MKRFSIIFILILLSVISSGCQTILETHEPPAVTTSAATLLDSATAEPSPTATEKHMTLQEKVDAFAAGKIEFPTDLSPEEYSAFVDGMNDHVGRQAIWVETFKNKDGSPVVLYFDTEKSDMVALPGSYDENKDTVDQNQMEVFVKISEEPETGNLQYINSKGVLVTSPNSADVNWNLRVDGSNYQDGLVDLPKIITDKKTKSDDWYNTWWSRSFENEEYDFTLIPTILMDNKVSMLTSFQGGWNEYPCLNILFIVTDEQRKPLYGIRKMVGPAPSTFLGFEGSTLDLTPGLYQLRATDTIKKFEAGAVYYVGIRNQQYIWNNLNKASIDDLQGVASAPTTYEETFNEDFPEDGNIILAASILVKKK